MLIQAKKINIIFIALTVFLFACNSNQKNAELDCTNFDWISANWMNDSDTSSLFFENWNKINDRTYKGISYILANNDTVFFESITLFKTDTGTFYNVVVPNQNEGNEVSFKLVSSENNTYIFENKNHDFPKVIGYHHSSADTINAWIEGIVKGKNRKENFLMWRKK